jgi:hypothetical protein
MGNYFSAVKYFNTLLEQKEELQKTNAKSLRFKRNYELFKSQLLEKDKIEFQDTETFSVGKRMPDFVFLLFPILTVVSVKMVINWQKVF